MADNQTPELFGQTPSQTVGPFFHYALPWEGCADLTGNSPLGARTELFAPEHLVMHRSGPRGAVPGMPVTIQGRVLDGAGNPVPDALVEIWQADAAGSYAGTPGLFTGFGRCATDENGAYRFLTILPGRVPGPGNRMQAPHAALGITARGLLKRLATLLYFEDGEGLAEDPILELVPGERRATLVARREGAQGRCYRFDIILLGPGETVFFEF
ncbi:MAG TPA: protocatechuate 3,4-dioxygenase subunit alpha [Rhizomicrobium sp.]|nr:protocatechuate 3,4-dioxygenase subunit alpha [Rhizomicrobium sp.]